MFTVVTLLLKQFSCRVFCNETQILALHHVTFHPTLRILSFSSVTVGLSILCSS